MNIQGEIEFMIDKVEPQEVYMCKIRHTHSNTTVNTFGRTPLYALFGSLINFLNSYGVCMNVNKEERPVMFLNGAPIYKKDQLV